MSSTRLKSMRTSKVSEAMAPGIVLNTESPLYCRPGECPNMSRPLSHVSKLLAVLLFGISKLLA